MTTMQWRTAVSNLSLVDANAAELLDELERMRPIRDADRGPRAVGRWLVESGEAGAIADDTVVWLHRLLLQPIA